MGRRYIESKIEVFCFATFFRGIAHAYGLIPKILLPTYIILSFINMSSAGFSKVKSYYPLKHLCSTLENIEYTRRYSVHGRLAFCTPE